jgi:hypothetical protein
MIAVEIKELNNQVSDIDSIPEFDDVGNVVAMELNLCYPSLMSFEKAFGNSRHDVEATRAQYVGFQTYHKVLTAIKEIQVRTGSYLLPQKAIKNTVEKHQKANAAIFNLCLNCVETFPFLKDI